MKLTQRRHCSTLEDFAKQYVEDRIEVLVQQGNWDNDRYPDISRWNERLSDLAEKLIDMDCDESTVDIFSATALLYDKALAKEAYLLGFLDGGHIQQKFSSHEFPANE